MARPSQYCTDPAATFHSASWKKGKAPSPRQRWPPSHREGQEKLTALATTGPVGGPVVVPGEWSEWHMWPLSSAVQFIVLRWRVTKRLSTRRREAWALPPGPPFPRTSMTNTGMGSQPLREQCPPATQLPLGQWGDGHPPPISVHVTPDKDKSQKHLGLGRCWGPGDGSICWPASV